MFKFFKWLFLTPMHRWDYYNPFDRTCTRCNEHQVQECDWLPGTNIVESYHHNRNPTWAVYREPTNQELCKECPKSSSQINAESDFNAVKIPSPINSLMSFTMTASANFAKKKAGLIGAGFQAKNINVGIMANRSM